MFLVYFCINDVMLVLCEDQVHKSFWKVAHRHGFMKAVKPLYDLMLHLQKPESFFFFLNNDYKNLFVTAQ